MILSCWFAGDPVKAPAGSPIHSPWHFTPSLADVAFPFHSLFIYPMNVGDFRSSRNTLTPSKLPSDPKGLYGNQSLRSSLPEIDSIISLISERFDIASSIFPSIVPDEYTSRLMTSFWRNSYRFQGHQEWLRGSGQHNSPKVGSGLPRGPALVCWPRASQMKSWYSSPRNGYTLRRGSMLSTMKMYLGLQADVNTRPVDHLCSENLPQVSDVETLLRE